MIQPPLRLSLSFFVLCANLTTGLRVAFLGDTGVETKGDNGFYAQAVFDLIHKEGVDLIIHNGDFDYHGDPQMFSSFLTSTTMLRGGEIGFLGTSGNHETETDGKRWFGPGGYKDELSKRLNESRMLASQCKNTESYGERYHCQLDESLFVMLGWRQTRGGEIAKSVKYMDEVLSSSNASLKWCVWHLPENTVNGGAGWHELNGIESLYEVCRKHGAIVTNGHSHIYSRTKLLSSFIGDPVVSDFDHPHDIHVMPGRTLSFVVGMGGYHFDGGGRYTDESWFRSTFTTRDSEARAGALICDVNGSTADCKFMLTPNGQVIDSFSISSSNA